MAMVHPLCIAYGRHMVYIRYARHTKTNQNNGDPIAIQLQPSLLQGRPRRCLRSLQRHMPALRPRSGEGGPPLDHTLPKTGGHYGGLPDRTLHSVPRARHHPEKVSQARWQSMAVHRSFQEGHQPMLYNICIDGTSPIIHHSSARVDPLLPINIEIAEITSKRGSNRTSADNERLVRLETIASLWLDSGRKPIIPRAAVRSLIETGARKLRQGAQVREGLVVVDTSFVYDVGVYGQTIDELAETARFTVPAVVKGIRVMRTRARFDPPWSCAFTVDGDDELVDRDKLGRWLDIGGRRVGLGDWRPEKSGEFGRFEVTSIEAREMTVTAGQ